MGLADQVVESYFNASGVEVSQGMVIRASLGSNQALLAQADNPANLIGTVGVVLSRSAAPSTSFLGACGGTSNVLLESGLSPQEGQMVYVSPTVAGRGTIIAPAIALELGVIINAQDYSQDETVKVLLLGALLPKGSADWNLTQFRYYIVDNDNGDDSNLGYIDAAAGTTFTAAQTSAVAIKTLQQLRNIMPRNGASHSAVVLIKPRSDAGNYLDQNGAQDYLDLGYHGYQYLAFRGSDHTNSASDHFILGGVIAEPGPNADGSWTVSAYNSSTYQLDNAAGVLPADDTIRGLQIQWVGNQTPGLLNGVNGVHYRGSDTALFVNYDTTPVPVNGDQYYLVRPGVKVTELRGPAGGPDSDTFSGSPLQGLNVAGIECTASVRQRGGSQPNLIFCRFNALRFEGGAIRSGLTYPDETGIPVNIVTGIDVRGTFSLTDMRRAQLFVCAWHGAVSLHRVWSYTLGEGSSSILQPTIRYCGSGLRSSETVSGSGCSIGSLNPLTKPGFRLDAGIIVSASRAVIAALNFPTGTSIGISLQDTCDVFIRNLRGEVDFIADVRDAQLSRVFLDNSDMASLTVNTAAIIGTGIGNKTLGDLGAANYIDDNGNQLLGSGGYTARRYTTGTVGNYPVLAADPTTPVNGDVWIKDTGGVRTINVRIGGVTYSTTLT